MTPRYLVDHVSPQWALLAETLFERELGYALAATEYTETVRYDPQRGARLTRTPVLTLVSVQGTSGTWGIHRDLTLALGAGAHRDIPVSDVHLHQRGDVAYVVLPVFLWGATYDEVTIQYVAGVSVVPDDVLHVIGELASSLERGETDEWGGNMPASVRDIADRYRRKEA